jgi:hypothetical protein
MLAASHPGRTGVSRYRLSVVCVVQLGYLFFLLAMVRICENYLSAVLQVIGELSLLWHVVAGHDVGVVRCRGTREGEKWS